MYEKSFKSSLPKCRIGKDKILTSNLRRLYFRNHCGRRVNIISVGRVNAIQEISNN